MALTKIDDRGLKTPIDLLDNEKIRLGTGNDLEIFHNAGFSYIDAKSDQLRIEADQLRVRSDAGETYMEADVNSAVKLYFDNSKKIETAGDGIEVFGNIHASGKLDLPDGAKLLLGTSDDLEIYHDGTHSYISEIGTGDLRITADSGVHIRKHNNENIAQFIANGSVDLYYDNSKKLETTASGVQITGGLNVTTTIHIPDGSIGLQIGNSNDLLIFHDGSNSYIKTTNTNTNLILEGAHGVDIKHGGENMAKFRPDSSVELYHNNTKKFETTDDGAAVFGYLQIHSLPAVSYSDTREIALTNADLTRSNFYNHTNFESDSTILDSNGHFVAPVHGIYRLYVRISTDDTGGNRANIRLRKNGTTINEAYATQGSSVHQSVSSEIICELNQGQYLDVQVAQMHTMVGQQHKVVNFHMLG